MIILDEPLLRRVDVGHAEQDFAAPADNGEQVIESCATPPASWPIAPEARENDTPEELARALTPEQLAKLITPERLARALTPEQLAKALTPEQLTEFLDALPPEMREQIKRRLH